MIRNPLGLRIDPDRPVRDQIYEAAKLGARGVVLDATGDLAPQRLGETGRRDLRNVLRSVELSLIAVALPTRRAFDSTDQLDERVRRADAAFAMAYELGTNLLLARVGPIPPEEEATRRGVFFTAVASLGDRADHRGVRLAIETGTDPGDRVRAFLDGLGIVGLAASIDPSSLLRSGIDPLQTLVALGPWVAHAYAPDASGTARRTANPRGSGHAPGALDWDEYIGALEEIGYLGFLTIWPEPTADRKAVFASILKRLAEIR